MLELYIVIGSVKFAKGRFFFFWYYFFQGRLSKRYNFHVPQNLDPAPDSMAALVVRQKDI